MINNRTSKPSENKFNSFWNFILIIVIFCGGLYGIPKLLFYLSGKKIDLGEFMRKDCNKDNTCLLNVTLYDEIKRGNNMYTVFQIVTIIGIFVFLFWILKRIFHLFRYVGEYFPKTDEFVKEESWNLLSFLVQIFVSILSGWFIGNDLKQQIVIGSVIFINVCLITIYYTYFQGSILGSESKKPMKIVHVEPIDKGNGQ